MNLLLLIMNMVLFVNILIPLSTAQQCKNCGKGNVAAKRIKMLNKSTFTRIAGVELDGVFKITPEKNMTVCAQRCDANLTCTVFEFNKPHKLCLLSTSYAVIDKDLVGNAFATAIFVKIVGKFAKKLPKGPESCLSRDEYSDYLITNVTEFLKNGTQTRNDTTSTSNGTTSNLPSTPPSEATSAASAASSTPGVEINHGTSGGTTTSDVETTSTPTDSDAPADSTTPSDAVTVEEEKATTASGLSPTASSTHVETIRDTTTTQKPSTVSPQMPSSSTSATETTKTTTATSTSSGTTTSAQPLRPSDPTSSSSVSSSKPTVSSTPNSSSKSSSTSADSTTAKAQKESSELLHSTTEEAGTETITEKGVESSTRASAQADPEATTMSGTTITDNGPTNGNMDVSRSTEGQVPSNEDNSSPIPTVPGRNVDGLIGSISVDGIWLDLPIIGGMQMLNADFAASSKVSVKVYAACYLTVGMKKPGGGKGGMTHYDNLAGTSDRVFDPIVEGYGGIRYLDGWCEKWRLQGR